MHRPRIRLLIGAAVALGPGKVALLEAIGQSGSISAAAREMGMSYRRAWSLVDRMNADFTGPLVEKVAGGKGGGGAQLSALGQDVLARYHAIEDKAAESVKADMKAFAPLLKEPE
jgi:molybdate transport system regulatory protein